MTPLPSRAVTVATDRLDLWLDRFEKRHGPLAWEMTPQTATAIASDGTTAVFDIPFPPLVQGESLTAHVLRERTIGVLLVRLGGFAAGVFEGPRLVASKCGSRPVHGRTSAGGSSQQRFARRRENQARVALDAAVAAAVRVLMPAHDTLDALVLGGDRRAVETVIADGALALLRPLVTGRLLDVPDPRRGVLIKAGALARLVHVRVVDPPA